MSTEREEFEAIFSKPPYEFDLARFDDRSAWPGNYRDYHCQCAWDGWQEARAALASAPATPAIPSAQPADAECPVCKWPVEVHDNGEACKAAPPPVQPAPEAAPIACFGLSVQQIDNLRTNGLKPEEIAGGPDTQLDRVRELVWWFARLAEGNANPKWLRSHAFELAYYIACMDVKRQIDLGPIRQAAFLQGMQVAPEERRVLERCGAIPPAAPAATQAQAGPVVDRSDAVNLARNMLEVRGCRGITERGVRVLCTAVMAMDRALAAPAATQQAPTDAQKAQRALQILDAIPCGACACRGCEIDRAEAARLLREALSAPVGDGATTLEAHQLRIVIDLLRDTVGPLEVSAAVIESDDTEQMEGLIDKIKAALSLYDAARAAQAGDGNQAKGGA